MGAQAWGAPVMPPPEREAPGAGAAGVMGDGTAIDTLTSWDAAAEALVTRGGLPPQQQQQSEAAATPKIEASEIGDGDTTAWRHPSARLQQPGRANSKSHKPAPPCHANPRSHCEPRC